MPEISILNSTIMKPKTGDEVSRKLRELSTNAVSSFNVKNAIPTLQVTRTRGISKTDQILKQTPASFPVILRIKIHHELNCKLMRPLSHIF
ncbi:hypothetical protein HI914_03845 [Erysiphe necator]|nr:hypothetical protein HI914_03845 [Erysiphe necator]